MNKPLPYNPWKPSKLTYKQRNFLRKLISGDKINEVEKHSIEYTLDKGEYNEGQRILFLQLRIKKLIGEL